MIVLSRLTKTVVFSIGVISILQLGEFLRNSNNAWIENTGMGVSLLAVVLTGVYLYKTTPIIIEEIKLRLKK